MATDKITTLLDTHTNNLTMMADHLNDLIKDHQRLAGDSTHDLTTGIQLYMRNITALQKTLLSLEEIKKEINATKKTPT